MKHYSILLLFFILITSIVFPKKEGNHEKTINIPIDKPNQEYKVISREEYSNKLYGFWLGECIANWTGLVTEMDKIGNIGEIKTGPFYTRNDWGKPDRPSIWGQGLPSNLSPTIDFIYKDEGDIWGSDDDTDIEYMYQYMLYINQTSILTAEQIRDGWLEHIEPDEENYLWVSNQKAYDLMKNGMLPPETSNPNNNEHFEMIDAQLTTEIFGLFSPTRPDIALKIAHLPIRTTAQKNAAWISEFYIVMHSLATSVDTSFSMKQKVIWLANEARNALPDSSYSAKMFDYVKSKYESGISWEKTRDSIYQRYQVDQMDGYNITSKKLYCNGCFAGGINFAASLVSLFYGEGNLKETIKIGALAGWDSDNPTATWGGLIGFLIGKDGIEKLFARKFSNKYNIHRTRRNFPNNGIDTFEEMAKRGISIVDRIVIKEMSGTIDSTNNLWLIPDSSWEIK